MALTWEWKNKIGEITHITSKGKTWTGNLYKCNGLFVELCEYEEDGIEMYCMQNFAVDETHFKRCLGLDKKHSKENIYTDWQKIVLLRNDEVSKKMLKEIARADWDSDLVIELKSYGEVLSTIYPQNKEE